MFTAVLGVVAVVGVLSVSVYSLLSGPIRTAAVVTAKTKAQTTMISAVKILVSMAEDTDADSIPELPEFVPGATIPVGGGNLPMIGVDLLDPWGTPYGYCTWDHGAVTGSADRLEGIDGDSSKLLIAVISAGPNRSFEVTCADINGPGDAGLDESANIDDIVEKYTLAEAGALAIGGGGGGDSLWEEVVGGIKYDTDRVGIGGDPDGAARLRVVGDTLVEGNVGADPATGAVSGFSGVFTNITGSRINVDGSVGGGAIDGTPIGATTASTGRFTTLETTDFAGTNTIRGTTGVQTLNVTSGGGTINNTVIGSPVPQVGAFTTLSATTLNVNQPGNTANIEILNATQALTTATVTNLTAEFLYDSSTPPAAGPRTGAFFRDATNLNAGTLNPSLLPTFTGDVSITPDTPTELTATVVGLRGRPVNAGAPGANDVLTWDGLEWIPAPIDISGSGGATLADINPIGRSSVWAANCAVGEIPKSVGANDWVCAADAGGFANPATVDLDMNGFKIINVGAIQMTSDFRLKKDVVPMQSTLKRLEMIQPVTFYWNDFARKKGYDRDKHLGLIAQDVEAAFPEAVITNAQGVKGIEYSSLTAVMLQAIRELSEQNRMLQGQINDLRRQINNTNQ